MKFAAHHEGGEAVTVDRRTRPRSTRTPRRTRGQKLAMRDFAMVALRDGVTVAGRRVRYTMQDLADIFDLDASHVGRLVAAMDATVRRVRSA